MHVIYMYSTRLQKSEVLTALEEELVPGDSW